MFSKFTGLLLVLSCLTFNNAFAKEGRVENTLSSKHQLVIASSNNFPPVNLLDKNGELTGFARELSEAVARSVNVETRYIQSSVWTDVLKWLDEGEADLIHDTGYTQERTSYLDFSLPIIEMPESIFVRAQHYDINNISSLSGKKVACVNQHITHIYLKRFKEIDCYIVNTPAEGLIALINGNVDAFIYPEQIVLYLAQQLELEKRIKVVGKPLRVLSWSMTVKKGNTEVLKLLNRGIKSVKERGEYQRIYDKWFGKRLLVGYTKNEVLIITAVSVLLALLFVIAISLFIYIRSMRTANQALMESDNKYRTLADKLPQSIYLKDTNSVYVSCNQRYADSLGITPEEIIGKTDYDFFSTADEYREGDRKILESKQTTEFIEKIHIDGKDLWVNTIKTPVYNEKDELSGVLGIFWDITEQRDLLKKHAEIIKEYDAITATVPDIMYKLNDKGCFTWWNDTFEKVTGLSSDKINNLYASEVITERDRDRVVLAMQQVFENGFSEVEAHLSTLTGELLYNFNGARLLDSEGNLLGLAGSGRDVTKQKESERQQELLQRQLAQAQRIESIGQLTGGIAHDFNNILGSILGYGELSLSVLERNPPIEKIRPYLTEIIRSGERARDLVKQMMVFSRDSVNKPHSVNVAQFIDELLSMLRPVIPSTIEITTEIDKDLPAIVIDSVMTLQMLLNLCINARDAMGGSGRLTISVKPKQIMQKMCDSCHNVFSGEYIQFRVGDTGAGINSELTSSIFEPFVTTKDVGKGTGMGLSMVHGIAHKHLGHICVNSEPGKTTFKIYLPVGNVADDSSVVNNNDSNIIINDNGVHHILVVDDELIIAELLNEILSSHGYRVTVKHNGQDALKAFTNNTGEYDMVITDQTMPNMTGKDMAIKILNVKPSLPIILCTGYSEQINEEEARKIGIRAFLRKPVNTNDLLKLIPKVLTA
ncbi:MAG: transporter substrate-binding domain-containing protein [Gammaproteobacteria bacterium]|nr:transporter substrate-binding domain-containing protein [Gammaproteobacteria bacterium]